MYLPSRAYRTVATEISFSSSIAKLSRMDLPATASHSFKLPDDETEIRLLLNGSKSMARISAVSFNIFLGFCVAPSQITILMFLLAEAKRLSSLLNLTSVISLSWAANPFNLLPLSVLHKLALLSLPPVKARVPSAETTKAVILPV